MSEEGRGPLSNNNHNKVAATIKLQNNKTKQLQRVLLRLLLCCLLPLCLHHHQLVPNTISALITSKYADFAVIIGHLIYVYGRSGVCPFRCRCLCILLSHSKRLLTTFISLSPLLFNISIHIEKQCWLLLMNSKQLKSLSTMP